MNINQSIQLFNNSNSNLSNNVFSQKNINDFLNLAQHMFELSAKNLNTNKTPAEKIHVVKNKTILESGCISDVGFIEDFNQKNLYNTVIDNYKTQLSAVNNMCDFVTTMSSSSKELVLSILINFKYNYGDSTIQQLKSYVN